MGALSTPNTQHLYPQVTIADVNYYSALRTPVDFKTFLHVKFPKLKFPSNWPWILERVNDQHSRGDQKTIKGAAFDAIEKRKYFNRGFEIHRLILNIYLSR